MRQIDNDVKPQWDQIREGKRIEMAHEDCPPSLLKGWTDDNLSLWEIDHPEKPDLFKILFALCRRKKTWDKDRISYLLFNKTSIDNAKLDLTQTNGNTGDYKIDNSKTHYEIKNLSAKNLSILIFHILISQFEVGQYKKSEFENTLLTAYDTLQIVPNIDTESMTVQSNLRVSQSDTKNKDAIQTELNIDRVYKEVSSGSVDPSTNKSTSTTSN